MGAPARARAAPPPPPPWPWSGSGHDLCPHCHFLTSSVTLQLQFDRFYFHNIYLPEIRQLFCHLCRFEKSLLSFWVLSPEIRYSRFSDCLCASCFLEREDNCLLIGIVVGGFRVFTVFTQIQSSLSRDITLINSERWNRQRGDSVINFTTATSATAAHILCRFCCHAGRRWWVQ